MCPYTCMGQAQEKSNRAGREKPCMQSPGFTDVLPHSHSWHHMEPGLSPSSLEPSTAVQHHTRSSQAAFTQCHSHPTLQHSHRQAKGLQIDEFLL